MRGGNDLQYVNPWVWMLGAIVLLLVVLCVLGWGESKEPLTGGVTGAYEERAAYKLTLTGQFKERGRPVENCTEGDSSLLYSVCHDECRGKIIFYTSNGDESSVEYIDLSRGFAHNNGKGVLVVERFDNHLDSAVDWSGHRVLEIKIKSGYAKTPELLTGPVKVEHTSIYGDEFTEFADFDTPIYGGDAAPSTCGDCGISTTGVYTFGPCKCNLLESQEYLVGDMVEHGIGALSGGDHWDPYAGTPAVARYAEKVKEMKRRRRRRDDEKLTEDCIKRGDLCNEYWGSACCNKNDVCLFSTDCPRTWYEPWTWGCERCGKFGPDDEDDAPSDRSVEQAL